MIMRARMELPRRMRVYRSCKGNAVWIERTGGYRAEGEILEIGPMAAKIFDLRDYLAIPLAGHNEGQFLLVDEFDDRTKELVRKWRLQYHVSSDTKNPARARAEEKAEEITVHLEILLTQYAATPHLQLVVSR